jgi:hypothetical protein
MREFLIGVGLALVGVINSPTRADANCPPYAPGNSFLEVLSRHASGPGPLTEAQVLELVQKGDLLPLLLYPSSGPAPLTVSVRWLVHPFENPVRVEFDADGDGLPEWIQSGYTPESGERNHTYQREGQFQFTVRIHGRGGQIQAYTVPVRVFTAATFEAELQGRWTSMKEALRRADIPAALECIHTESRSRYGRIFAALASPSALDVDRTLTTIRFVERRMGAAEYEMLRAEGGVTLSFSVRFQIDADGVWRLRLF